MIINYPFQVVTTHTMKKWSTIFKVAMSHCFYNVIFYLSRSWWLIHVHHMTLYVHGIFIFDAYKAWYIKFRYSNQAFLFLVFKMLSSLKNVTYIETMNIYLLVFLLDLFGVQRRLKNAWWSNTIQMSNNVLLLNKTHN